MRSKNCGAEIRDARAYTREHVGASQGFLGRKHSVVSVLIVLREKQTRL